MKPSKEIKRTPKLALEKECTGCAACHASCHFNAINAEIRNDGHIYYVIDRDKCVGCMACEKVCLSSRQMFGNNQLTNSALYAAWDLNESYRHNATSGGAFSALARAILHNGGYVVGAKLEKFDCRHALIADEKKLGLLQGSKYMYSAMQGIYEEVQEKLKYHDVLFTGTGCQCAGVLAFFEKKKYMHRLYTVDIVCGGVSSPILIKKYCERYPDVEEIISFRNKNKYELKVRKNGQEVVDHKKNLPLHGFNCGLTNRYSCYQCQFAKAHRKTDITIGDLWDQNALPSEHEKGISMLIVHSQQGHELLQKSELFTSSLNWRNTLLKNPRTICERQTIFYPRVKLANFSKTMSYEKFRKLYCMDISVKSPLLFVFRLYRFAIQRIEKEINRRKIISVTEKYSAHSSDCKEGGRV